MRVLVIKTSSMGDIIHTLPAITDAVKAIPGIKFDWLVEENFAEIPGWHPAVDNIIKVAWRRWRKTFWKASTWLEWREFRAQLAAKHYDVIIDAQGLIKSAFFSKLATGIRCGFATDSVRERFASLFYQKKYSVGRSFHAVTRLRFLFSQVLNYTFVDDAPDYGIDKSRLRLMQPEADYLVFLHGTTWETKHWPETYWVSLGEQANAAGLAVKIPWGSAAELERAGRIAAQLSHASVLPKLNLMGMARELAGAKAIIAVDTGLGHLAAALNVPAVSLYGPTNPGLTGALGKSQLHLTATFPCSPCLSRYCTYKTDPTINLMVDPPCFSTLNPSIVWEAVEALLEKHATISIET